MSEKVGKRIGIRLVLALGVAMSVSLAHADARDGLKFWWKAEKKTAVCATMEAREFTERVTYSAAASPATPTKLTHNTNTVERADGSVFTATPMVITNMAVYCPTSRRTVYEDCIYLPQPTNYNASGTLMQDFQSITLPGASSVIDKEGTVFIRFKWSGRCESTSSRVNLLDIGGAWTTCGWTLTLFGYGSRKNAYAELRNFKTGKNVYNAVTEMVCPADVWIEMAVTVKPVVVDGVEKTEVKFYKRREDRDNFDKLTATADAITKSTGSNRRCIISNSGSTWGNDGDNSNSFRGFIHEIKMYDRVLDDDEVLQLMSGDEVDWTVGTKNDSGSEFSESETEAVFAPETMPWYKMRKCLTAANPSVSIRTDLDANGFDLARLLHFRVMGDVPRFSRLAVLLNGRKIGDKDLKLATDENDGNVYIFIPSSAMQTLSADAETGKYPMTLTLARTGEMSGTIAFDYISLGGAFQLGKPDGSNTEFGSNDPPLRYYSYQTPLRNTKRMATAVGAIANYTQMDIAFYMTGTATNYPHVLNVATFNSGSYSLYLNEKTESGLLRTVT